MLDFDLFLDIAIMGEWCDEWCRVDDEDFRESSNFDSAWGPHPSLSKQKMTILYMHNEAGKAREQNTTYVCICVAQYYT